MPQLPKRFALDAVRLDDVKALVVELLIENGLLRDEIARLKGLPPRPPFKPSRMEDGTEGERQPGDKRTGKGVKQPRNGGAKGSRRTADLTIDDEKVLKAPELPQGSRFKGRRRFVVQDLRLEPHVTRYHRECWRTPEGTLVTAPLPPGIVGHFGPNLVRFVLQQSYECNLTEPKLLAQLHAFGIKISLACLSNLLTEGNAAFHAEKQEILASGSPVPAPSPSTTRAPGTKAAMPTRCISATSTSPSSRRQTARAVATSSRRCSRAGCSATASTLPPSPIASSTGCRPPSP